MDSVKRNVDGAARNVAAVNGATRGKAMSSTLRCLRVLELIGREPFEWSLSEIAGALGVSKGTAHRLIATLREGGYIGQTENRRYFIEGKTFAIGTAFLRHSLAYRAAFP